VFFVGFSSFHSFCSLSVPSSTNYTHIIKDFWALTSEIDTQHSTYLPIFPFTFTQSVIVEPPELYCSMAWHGPFNHSSRGKTNKKKPNPFKSKCCAGSLKQKKLHLPIHPYPFHFVFWQAYHNAYNLLLLPLSLYSSHNINLVAYQFSLSFKANTYTQQTNRIEQCFAGEADVPI